MFEEEAWSLAVTGAHPLVFQESGSWVVANPFEPQARHWLALPMVAAGELLGVVIASSSVPINLDPTTLTVLTLLGDQLTAGIATARLRQQLQHAELERERMRLAAEVHDGLAQDLALAMRELALLESDPPPDAARASQERLREAVAAAHRLVRARLVDLSTTAAARWAADRTRGRLRPLRAARAERGGRGAGELPSRSRPPPPRW